MSNATEKKIEHRRVTDLRPHPENEKIYGDDADADLVKSVGQEILQPLLIAYDNRIIVGHRRWKAAQRAGLETVPTITFGSTDELDILEALLEGNRQRTKTNEQMAREYLVQKRIARERSSRQGQRTDLVEAQHGTSVSPETEVKAPSVQAADKVGKSKATLERAAVVVEEIDRATEDGDLARAEELRQKLNSNVRGAYNKVRPTSTKKKPYEVTASQETPALKSVPLTAAASSGDSGCSKAAESVPAGVSETLLGLAQILVLEVLSPGGLDQNLTSLLAKVKGWPAEQQEEFATYTENFLRLARSASKRIGAAVGFDARRKAMKEAFGERMEAAVKAYRANFMSPTEGGHTKVIEQANHLADFLQEAGRDDDAARIQHAQNLQVFIDVVDLTTQKTIRKVINSHVNRATNRESKKERREVIDAVLQGELCPFDHEAWVSCTVSDVCNRLR